jgi:hypothetical protein
MQYNYAVLGANQANAQATQSIQSRQQNQSERQEVAGYLGSAFTALSTLFPTSSGGNASAAVGGQPAGLGTYQPTNMAGQPTGQRSGTNAMGMVFDPFTNQWVYPSS